jgi:cardiolipin synthase
MDFWSFSTNEEINAVILSREFALEMEEMFERDLAESDQIRLEDWGKRSILTRIREQLAHLFARWL